MSRPSARQLSIFEKGVLFMDDREEAKRDLALDSLADARALLVGAARSRARMIAMRNGRVTSPEVLEALREGGYGPQLDRVDRRFMGVVFRPASAWECVGRENTGSHRRSVPIWRLA